MDASLAKSMRNQDKRLSVVCKYTPIHTLLSCWQTYCFTDRFSSAIANLQSNIRKVAHEHRHRPGTVPLICKPGALLAPYRASDGQTCCFKKLADEMAIDLKTIAYKYIFFFKIRDKVALFLSIRLIKKCDNNF